MKALPMQKIEALKTRVDNFAQDAVLTASITAGLAAARIEEQLLKLPRPLKSSSDDQLMSALGKLGSGLITGIYMVKSGKTTSLGLVDRRLNKFGKVSARIGLVMTAALTPLVLHELWARQREQSVSLDGAAAEDFMQNMSYADMLAALKKPINLDQLDGLVARIGATPPGNMSNLRFDQIATGKG